MNKQIIPKNLIVYIFIALIFKSSFIPLIFRDPPSDEVAMIFTRHNNAEWIVVVTCS